MDIVPKNRTISLKMDRDPNGNKILRVAFIRQLGFSVQTNGNLPETHRMSVEGFDHKIAIAELKAYIVKYGTSRQRALTGWSMYRAGC